MKNCIVFAVLLLSFGITGADSYPDLMDQAEKLMNRRYEKGSRAYKIKSAELDEILESRETKAEKIARLKKFIAEFQVRRTGQPATRESVRAQVVAYLRDVKQCEAEAQNGNSAAQFALGLHYWNRKNPQRNPRLAVKWAQRAAQSGFSDASVLVATILLEGGDGVDRNPAEGVRLLRDAAEQGNAEAMAYLGNLYTKGDVVTQDRAMAFQWYRKAAENGNAACMYLTAMAYYQGLGIAQSDSQALAWFRKAAETAWHPAYLMLGKMYEQGKGTAVNYTEAFQWFERAAKHNAEAYLRLGEMYMDARGVARDDRKATACFLECARRNALTPDGAYRLATLYYRNGDPVNAEAFFRKAAESVPMANYPLGEMAFRRKQYDRAMEYFLALEKAVPEHPGAAWYMGLIYDMPAYRGHDSGKALKCFRIAADGGNREAALRLGKVYAERSGKLTDAERSEALRLLLPSAKEGSADAMRKVGELYLTGGKASEALKWFRRAAKEGDVKAMYRLSLLYSGGKYVPRNYRGPPGCRFHYPARSAVL